MFQRIGLCLLTTALSFSGQAASGVDWSAAELQQEIELEAPISRLAFSSDSEWLAGAGESTLKVWEVATGTGPEYQVLELPAETTTPDPVALARRHYGLQEPSPVTTEHIEQRMLDTGAVQVTLTLNNLKDDSIRAVRYRLRFEPSQAEGWELIRVERKQQCRRGPTERDQWTGELCL